MQLCVAADSLHQSYNTLQVQSFISFRSINDISSSQFVHRGKPLFLWFTTMQSLNDYIIKDKYMTVFPPQETHIKVQSPRINSLVITAQNASSISHKTGLVWMEGTFQGWLHDLVCIAQYLKIKARHVLEVIKTKHMVVPVRSIRDKKKHLKTA